MAQNDPKNRIGGLLFVKIDGRQVRVRGKFTFGTGVSKKEAVVGLDGVHGYKEMPQVAYLEGEISDTSETDILALQNLRDGTVTFEYGSGKAWALRNAWHAGDNVIDLEEGSAQVRFEALSAAKVA